MARRAPIMTIEGPVKELTGNRTSLFVFTPPIGFDEQGATRLHQAWIKMWARAGRSLDDTPQLLVLPPFSRLEALTDDALKEHGLLRIAPCPNPPTDKSFVPAKTRRSRTRTGTSGA